jgi:hypothetical protein
MELSPLRTSLSMAAGCFDELRITRVVKPGIPIRVAARVAVVAVVAAHISNSYASLRQHQQHQPQCLQPVHAAKARASFPSSRLGLVNGGESVCLHPPLAWERVL